MTVIGTSHFVSREAAVSYYSAYSELPEHLVTTKLAEGEIKIGPPELKPGETLVVISHGTRYAVKS